MAFAIGWLRYRPRYGDRDCESRGAVDPSAALLIWPSNPFRLWPVSVLVRWAVVRSATFHGPLMMIEILITRLELKAAPKQYEIELGRQTDAPLEGFFLEWTPMHARAHRLNPNSRRPILRSNLSLFFTFTTFDVGRNDQLTTNQHKTLPPTHRLDPPNTPPYNLIH